MPKGQILPTPVTETTTAEMVKKFEVNPQFTTSAWMREDPIGSTDSEDLTCDLPHLDSNGDPIMYMNYGYSKDPNVKIHPGDGQVPDLPLNRLG